MKIAQVVDKFLPITESWIYSQIKGLQDLGINSEAFCHKIINHETHPFSPIHSYKDIPAWQTNYYRLKGKLLNKDGATLYWNKFIKNADFDLVHSHFGWAAQKGIDLAIRNNIPHIATFYGADVTRDPFDPNKQDYQKKLEIIFDYSKKILCTSNFLKENLIKLGAPKEKITVWRPAIKVKEIKNDKNNQYFNIISVGRFNHWKGQMYLIEAIFKVIKKYQNIRVNFIGNGYELKKCQLKTKKLNLEKNIFFLGSMEHQKVLEYISRSDLMVHPSIKSSNGQCDSLGVVLAEAAMCKVPAIATDVGGMPEIVINNKTGFLVKEKDSDDIAKNILKLYQDRALLESMSNNAYHHCSKMFNYNKQIDSLKNVITT